MKTQPPASESCNRVIEGRVSIDLAESFLINDAGYWRRLSLTDLGYAKDPWRNAYLLSGLKLRYQLNASHEKAGQHGARSGSGGIRIPDRKFEEIRAAKTEGAFGHFGMPRPILQDRQDKDEN